MTIWLSSRAAIGRRNITSREKLQPRRSGYICGVTLWRSSTRKNGSEWLYCSILLTISCHRTTLLIRDSFATFVRDKASIWTGTATTEYADVEHHHAASASNGLDVQIAPQSESTDVDKGSGHNADPEGHDADMQKATEVLHEHLVAAETEQREKEPGDASTRRFQSEEATSDTTDVSIDGAKIDGYPDFGHNMRQYWPFNPNSTSASLCFTPYLALLTQTSLLYSPVGSPRLCWATASAEI